MVRIPGTLCTAFMAACLGQSGPAAGAAGPDAVSGQVILSIRYDSDSDGVDEVFEYDLETIEEMPTRTFETSTIWTDGTLEFTGVPLTALLDSVGAEDGTIRAIALNEYFVDIPISDLEGDLPIVAYRLNGEPMSIRDKGPLWIVYPYDSHPRYQDEVKYQRSIWQLNALEIDD